MFGVAARTARKWSEDGMPGRAAAGWDLSKVVQWRRDQDRRLYEAQLDTTPQRRCHELRAEIMEIKLREAQGLVVARSEVRDFVGALLRDFRDQLLGLGRALVADFESVPARAREALVKQRISDLLSNIADAYATTTEDKEPKRRTPAAS